MTLPRLLQPRLALAFALLCLPLAALAEWRDIPYADVARMPLTLDRVDPQHILTARLVAKPGKGLKALPADLRLQVKVNGQLIPVAIAADGSIQLPIRQDWVEAGAVLQSNQPKGVVAVSMNFDTRTPAGTQMSYAKLTESAPVIERGIADMAGLMSFMAPDVKALVLKFAGPGHTAVLTLPGGKQKSWKADSQGRLELPWEPKWAAGTVELSAPLAGIDQILK